MVLGAGQEVFDVGFGDDSPHGVDRMVAERKQVLERAAHGEAHDHSRPHAGTVCPGADRKHHHEA